MLDDQLYKGDHCLSGTAEMSLAGYLMNRELCETELPLRLAAVSRCYRAETSRMTEERGIYRCRPFTFLNTQTTYRITFLPRDSPLSPFSMLILWVWILPDTCYSMGCYVRPLLKYRRCARPNPSEVVPVHVMKVKWGRESTAQHILNLHTRDE
jgi:hypothetical protein